MDGSERTVAQANLASEPFPPPRRGWPPAAPQMRRLVRTLLACALAGLLSAARPAVAGNIIHIVQAGEDLYRIGLAYGIGWQAIMAANGLYSTVIYVGEALIIPDGAGTPGSQPAQPVAPAPAPQPQPAAPAPAPADGRYMIQRGDTLWLVARRFQVTVSQLMVANAIANPNYIYYGQVLVIPGQSAAAEGKVLSVAGRAQALPLDCESRSAVDWAAYFGVSIGELDFLGKLPESDDPDAGFVGNAHGSLGQTPPGDYGVHAGPVADLLRAYGVSARRARAHLGRRPGRDRRRPPGDGVGGRAGGLWHILRLHRSVHRPHQPGGALRAHGHGHRLRRGYRHDPGRRHRLYPLAGAIHGLLGGAGRHGSALAGLARVPQSA